MEIVEQQIVGKDPRKGCEDGLVVTPDFVAVIDGSTSKSRYRHSWWRSNGRHAMKIVARYISHMPATITSEQFLTGVSAAVRRHYKKSMLPRLQAHPEDRLTCSVVVYSRLSREVWMVGDCQCLLNGDLYDNPKPYEAELAAKRAAEVRRLLAEGTTPNDLLRNRPFRHHPPYVGDHAPAERHIQRGRWFSHSPSACSYPYPRFPTLGNRACY